MAKYGHCEKFLDRNEFYQEYHKELTKKTKFRSKRLWIIDNNFKIQFKWINFLILIKLAGNYIEEIKEWEKNRTTE